MDPMIQHLLLFAVLATQPLLASSRSVLVLEEGNGGTTVPSAATLAGCRTSCGNLTFRYPFGIGAGCFLEQGFELICIDDSAGPPKLYFRDGITQVVHNIFTGNTLYVDDYGNNYIAIALSYTIPMRNGVDVYNVSWNPPGKSFSLHSASFNITGCGFDIFTVDRDTNTTVQFCSLVCPVGITDTVARHNCNGTGCCQLVIADSTIRHLGLNFVRRRRRHMTNRSSFGDHINATTNYAKLDWNIIDQPSCASYKENHTSYACVANNSQCIDTTHSLDFGYSCGCNPGYYGNPYILNGCSKDMGYNPVQQNTNCRPSCGSIHVPFPFGIELGCSAREQFYLNCTNMTSSTLLLGNSFVVTEIDIEEGLVKLTSLEVEEGSVETISSQDTGVFSDSGESVSWKWVAANLTCEEAHANSSGYACVSTNSTCIPVVNNRHGYLGYKCNCSHGFKGNPYVKNGCQDIDECKDPSKCHGICHNTQGSYICTKCPDKTTYDPIKMQCSLVKQQNVLEGVVIGVSSGLVVLLLGLCAIYLTRKWRKNIQKRMRRN